MCEKSANNIEIQTSDNFGAGTNGDIDIQLTGNDQTSPWIRLDDDKDNFESGDVDKFWPFDYDLELYGN